MKPLQFTFALLLIACLLQNCQENNIDPSDKKDLQVIAQSTKVPFSMSAIVSSTHSTPPNQFLVYLGGTDGEIEVDWGDGTDTTYLLNGSLFEIEKVYASEGRYQVNITGDIKNITFFQSSYGEGVFDSINFSSLPKLSFVEIGLTPGPHTIDLSRNNKLTGVHLTNVNELTEVILPVRHWISTASIAGPNYINSATADEVIANIYNNAVKKKLYDGYFNVSLLYYEDPEYYKELVGPPSAESVTKLRELQDVYHWMIVPRL